MPIQRAKPLDFLYSEVADCDLVLVPDAPLASALNRRIDRAHFGTFATTPRRLAAGRREGAEDRTAFLEVIERTDHDWTAVSYAVGNVLQCWEHEGDREAIYDYDAYADDVTRDVVEILGELRTTSGRLAKFAAGERSLDAESVAVVGEDQLTPLERSILPAAYERVDLFTGEPFDRPRFEIFESSAAIVDAILDTVDAGTADDVAIVLDASSRYSALVESALEAAGVPFYGGPGFLDRQHHRNVLALCRAAFRGEGTTVADVRPICSLLGADVPVAHDAKRIGAVDHPAIEWVREFCDALESRSFAEAVGAYERRADADLDALRGELDALGLLETAVIEDRVDDLAAYLQRYEVPVDRQNEGVLLADATSAGHVDRPVVFHVGIDEGWTHAAPQRPWVDAEVQYERNVGQFQRLLQSGVEQYFLVQDSAGGQPVTPCLYFGELLDAEFERFGDLDSVTHTRPAVDPADATGATGIGFEREPLAVPTEEIETISNSSLTTYVNCPRDYVFDRVLDSPDRDYFTEGNLFHDFAEFYVNHPDAVDEATIEAVVDQMLEAAGPFFSDADRPLRRRTYRLGLETIVQYLDERGPESDDFLTPASGWGTNDVADHFGMEVDSPLTERWFENLDLGVKGKIDLVRAPDHLLDYKSGSKTSARTVVGRSAVDPPDDTPEFQAALYLCHYRSRRPDEPLQFTFFHVLETLDDLIAGEHDLDDALTTVQYYPHTFADHVGSRAAYDELLDCWTDCVATFEDLGFEAYADVVDGLSVPDPTDDLETVDLSASDFAAAFTDAVVDATSDDVDAEKGCEQAIRRLDRIRGRTFFRDDLDAVEAFVEERIAALNRHRAGEERFPVAGPGGEPNYRRVDHRDCILEGSADD